jgi:hypothetical protein
LFLKSMVCDTFGVASVPVFAPAEFDVVVEEDVTVFGEHMFPFPLLLHELFSTSLIDIHDVTHTHIINI